MAIGDLLCASDYRVELHAAATDLLMKPPGDEPACILLDLRMADCSGPQLQDRLTALGSTIPIIFLTGHGDIPTVVQAIKAGAEDVLTKPVGKARLLETIERALMHGEELRERESQDEALQSQMSRLTSREYDVFTLLAQGKPHKQIAFVLGISERTVKARRAFPRRPRGGGSSPWTPTSIWALIRRARTKRAEIYGAAVIAPFPFDNVARKSIPAPGRMNPSANRHDFQLFGVKARGPVPCRMASW